jgi:hypothetical protein
MADGTTDVLLKNDKAVSWMARAGSSRQSAYKRKLQLLEQIGAEG